MDRREWRGSQVLAHTGREARLRSSELYKRVWGGTRRIRLDLGPERHVRQVLQVPPHVNLHQGRKQNKVLAVGRVPVQPGTWGLSSRIKIKLGKSKRQDSISRPSGLPEPPKALAQ